MKTKKVGITQETEQLLLYMQTSYDALFEVLNISDDDVARFYAIWSKRIAEEKEKLCKKPSYHD